MNFRQRLACLSVLLFLAGTFGLFYYIFEISERYNAFALEHVENFHGDKVKSTGGLSRVVSLFHHITDIPLSVWIILFTLPYLQIFFILLACTKPEPRLSMALKWPGMLILKCHRLYKKLSGIETSTLKPSTTAMMNGHVVIDA